MATATEQAVEEPQSGLIERWRDGDPAAFEALVAQYAPLAGRLISGLIDDRHAVADLVQETFIRAHRGRSAYRGGDPASWLGRIAVNVARDHHRAGWNRRVDLVAELPTDAGPSADEPEPHSLHGEEAARIRAAMAQLPAHQAEAVRLRYLLGTSYVEMTSLLSAPESTLRSRVKAGLERLRELLADYFAEDVG